MTILFRQYVKGLNIASKLLKICKGIRATKEELWSHPLLCSDSSSIWNERYVNIGDEKIANKDEPIHFEFPTL